MIKSWPEALKLITVLATIVGSAVGSYKAAQHEAKASANVSYEVMRESIEGLKTNQKMIWDVVIKAPVNISKSVDFSAQKASRPWAGFVITNQLPKTLDEAVKNQKTAK